MKKGLLILFILLGVACSRKENTTISGTISGGAGTMLYLEQLNVNQTKPVDSLRVRKDDSFRFRIAVTEPELFVLRNNTGKIINLLPMPEENITVTSSLTGFGKPYTVSGSPESEKILALVDRLNQTRSDLDSIGQELVSLSDQDSEEAHELKRAYLQTHNDQKKYTIRFLLENISCPSSIFALYQKFSSDEYVLNDSRDLQYLIIVSDSLEAHYPNSSLTMSLLEDVRKQKNTYNQMITLGNMMDKGKVTGSMDLAVPDRNGDTIRLHDLKGKVVLLSYWATWDKNSLDANLSLKDTWKKYHQKGFEVYSVSLDNSRDQWTGMIRYEQYPWINVCELTYPDSYAALVYNVQQLPTSYLIDRKGDIVARNLYGKELEKWLDNIL